MIDYQAEDEIRKASNTNQVVKLLVEFEKEFAVDTSDSFVEAANKCANMSRLYLAAEDRWNELEAAQ